MVIIKIKKGGLAPLLCDDRLFRKSIAEIKNHEPEKVTKPDYPINLFYGQTWKFELKLRFILRQRN